MSATVTSLRALAVAGLGIALSASSLLVPPTSGAAAQRGSAPAGAASAGAAPAGAALVDGPTTVTLVTGDRVRLVPSPSGEPQVVLEGGSAAQDDYSVRRDGQRIEVIPHDVLDLVPEVLDPGLFDVAGLVAMGYDDAHSDSVPLIVHRAPGVATLDADPALDEPVELPSIRSTAVRLDKQGARGFGADLAALAARPGPATSSVTAAALGGIDKIWLDRKVSAARAPANVGAPAPAATGLDGYLTQLGAPAAWAKGLDGTGVTVAVLDTGIDSGHPSLIGRVRAEANFTDTGSADDVAGHGTHVASLIAGSGAGTDGARQGIAPAADLLNGKVLNDTGGGQISWIISGMDWAVGQKADIVNLSLGSPPGETDDPVVQALDRLAARDPGTLFVVAAGNDGAPGWRPQTVTSPGTAASALTVGAVDEHDDVTFFSGQGPTRGSYRTKPDVVAPGVNILGARAGARETDLYVPQSGTSMATPLVAGAAALVKQQHPDWSWERLRSAVTTSADHLEWPTLSGAGRLALERMVEVETTVVPSSISPGAARHPYEGLFTATVTLTNTGSEPRTYTATDAQSSPDDGATAPESALVVEPETVTIAGGETATVDVGFDVAQVDDGFWHGHVDLTADDGSVLRLPFATYDEPERYWLDVTVLDRNGAPYADARVPFLNIEDGYLYIAHLGEKGHARLRVAPGTYGAVSVIRTGEGGAQTTTVAGTPALDVRADTAITLDAREAQPVRPPAVRGQETRPTDFSMLWNVVASNGNAYGDSISPHIKDVLAGRVFVDGNDPDGPGVLDVATRWRLEPEGRRASRTPDAYELVYRRDHLASPAPVLTPGDVAQLAEVTEHSYAPRPGAAVSRGLMSATSSAPGIVQFRQTTAPGTQTVLMTADDDVRWGYDSRWLDDSVWLYSPELTPRTRGSRVTHHFRRGLHVGIPSGSAHRSAGVLYVRQMFSDGSLVGPIPDQLVRSSSLRLYRGDELVGDSPFVDEWFNVGPERASYRLVGEVGLTDGRHAKTQWEFTSEESTDPNAGATVPPLLAVDYRPAVDLLGASPRGKDLRFDLAIGHLADAAAGERIEAVRLHWSADGGATWGDTTLRRTGDSTFAATVEGKELRVGDAVSVRLRAADGEGNAIDQTIIDFVPLG